MVEGENSKWVTGEGRIRREGGKEKREPKEDRREGKEDKESKIITWFS